MATLRIRFVNSSDIVGTLIDIVTDSNVDHVELDSGTGWLGAHSSGGIQNRPYNYMTPSREFIFELEVEDVLYANGMAKARSKIGTLYNFGAIISDALHDPSIDQVGRFDCSQFAYWVLQLLGFVPLNRQVLQAHNVTPGGLMLSPIFDGKLISKAG